MAGTRREDRRVRAARAVHCRGAPAWRMSGLNKHISRTMPSRICACVGSAMPSSGELKSCSAGVGGSEPPGEARKGPRRGRAGTRAQARASSGLPAGQPPHHGAHGLVRGVVQRGQPGVFQRLLHIQPLGCSGGAGRQVGQGEAGTWAPGGAALGLPPARSQPAGRRAVWRQKCPNYPDQRPAGGSSGRWPVARRPGSTPACLRGQGSGKGNGRGRGGEGRITAAGREWGRGAAARGAPATAALQAYAQPMNGQDGPKLQPS